MSRKNSIKEHLIKDFMILGDSCVGKTSLLNRFRNDYFDDEHQPTIYDRADFEVVVDDETHIIRLHDTNSHQRLLLSRKSIYDHASCLLVCYAVDNHTSYQSVVCNWTKEFMLVSRFVPIVLIATKVDLRHSNPNCVTTEEGEILRQQINANSFVECSAKENINIKETIYEAVRASILGVPQKTQETEETESTWCFCCPSACKVM